MACRLIYNTTAPKRASGGGGGGNSKTEFVFLNPQFSGFGISVNSRSLIEYRLANGSRLGIAANMIRYRRSGVSHRFGSRLKIIETVARDGIRLKRRELYRYVARTFRENSRA